MDQNNQLPLAKAELLECLGIQHFFDPLQLGKMVAAPNSTKHLVKPRGLKLRCSKDFAHIAVPRMLQVEPKLSPAVQLDMALNQVGSKQRHTATDVAADQVRVNDAVSHECGSDWRAFAWVQIRETHCQSHPIEFCRRIKLTERFAFNPAPG